MKGCPRCESMDAWVLGDGRLKCQSCGRRYSWKSVWGSMRLSEHAKEALLDAFVRGVPAAQCMVEQACADSRERFYRLARACCARYEGLARDGLSLVECKPPPRGARSMMRGWSTSHSVMIVGIADRRSAIQITAPTGAAGVLPLLRERAAVGGVIQFDATQAYACLQVQGEYVIVPRTPRAALVLHPAEAFWHHARVHLQTFRKIPVKFFPLYLAEACLRFNQRGQDLRTLLYDVMNATAIGELKPLRGPDPSGSTTILRANVPQLTRAASKSYREHGA
jgi:transposase